MHQKTSTWHERRENSPDFTAKYLSMHDMNKWKYDDPKHATKHTNMQPRPDLRVLTSFNANKSNNK